MYFAFAIIKEKWYLKLTIESLDPDIKFKVYLYLLFYGRSFLTVSLHIADEPRILIWNIPVQNGFISQSK